MMRISQWGADCIEELISIFSLSNTRSEGGDDYAMAHLNQNNRSVRTSVHLLHKMNKADICYCLRLL